MQHTGFAIEADIESISAGVHDKCTTSARKPDAKQVSELNVRVLGSGTEVCEPVLLPVLPVLPATTPY
eukprot:8276724-Pyramimonas_sp.AAC.1